MIDFVMHMICGLLIGASSIIPGMSGGTMAVILDIFDQMIAAIGSLRRNFWRSVSLLLPIGIGMVLGVILLSGTLSDLLQRHPVQMQFFFLGVVVGSSPLVLRKALEEPFRRHSLLALMVTLAVMLCIFFTKADDAAYELIRNPSLIESFQLALYAAFAAAAMIIPGVSGSFFLMLFGVYHTVLLAVGEMNVAVLLPVGIGMLAGILFCAKLIDLCMQHAKQAMYFGILGCILGSIPNLWPQGIDLSGSVAPAIVFFLMGLVVSVICTSPFLHRLLRWYRPDAKKYRR